MHIQKRTIVYLIITMILFILGGCHTDNQANSKSESRDIVLTEQQKQILTAEALPLDYNKLTSRQQAYLKTTDKMMTYINEKYAPYGVHFTYLAYHPAELLDTTTSILVVPDGYDPSVDVVEVKVNADIEEGYEDNYLDFAIRIVYEQVIIEHFAEFLPEDKFRVYATCTSIENMPVEYLAKLSKEYVLQNTVSSVDYIYISEAVCESGEPFVKFTEEYFSWLYEHDFRGHQDLYLYEDEGINALTSQSHPDTRWDYAIENIYGSSYDNNPYTLDRDTLDYLKSLRQNGE